MKSRNDIVTDSIDLTFIFIKGGAIDVYDEDVTTLYAINYNISDYPINSIDFPTSEYNAKYDLTFYKNLIKK
jgi:hypothetical protein